MTWRDGWLAWDESSFPHLGDAREGDKVLTRCGEWMEAGGDDMTQVCVTCEPCRAGLPRAGLSPWTSRTDGVTHLRWRSAWLTTSRGRISPSGHTMLACRETADQSDEGETGGCVDCLACLAKEGTWPS